jgi:hypothetical protein
MTQQWILDLTPDQRDAYLDKYSIAIAKIWPCHWDDTITIEDVRERLRHYMSPQWPSVDGCTDVACQDTELACQIARP